MNDIVNFLWVEKYRPKKIEDCVLPESLKETFQDMIRHGESQNLLLSGGPGCGKTTVAKALCDELDTDCMVINCSEDGNIDTLRTKIKTFASSVSLSGNKKVVILDEFDYSNAQSMQPALRGFMEEFSSNCRFILTCNYKNRIISPLHSRCTCIEFNIPSKEKPKLASEFLKRIKYILDSEEIEYNEKVIAQLIMRFFPDFRRIIKDMKDKNFIEVRKWVVENLDNSPVDILREIYEALYEYMEKSSIPEAVILVADYQYKSAFVADHEINLTSCLVELMMRCDFK